MPDGDFYKGGFGGQGLYISPTRDLVIAFFGTRQEPERANNMMSVAQQLERGLARATEVNVTYARARNWSDQSVENG